MSDFTEHDLIAFHLNELSLQRELELRTALATDPELAAESQEIAATLGLLRDHAPSPVVTAAVAEHHWQRLRPALAPARATPIVWWRSFSLGTVCGLALPCLYLLLLHTRAPGPTPPAPAQHVAAAASPDRSSPSTQAETNPGTVRNLLQPAAANCIMPAPRFQLAENAPLPPAAPFFANQQAALQQSAAQNLAASATASPPRVLPPAADGLSSLPVAGRSVEDLPRSTNQSVMVESAPLPVETASVSPALSQLPNAPRKLSRHPVTIVAAALGNLTLARTADSQTVSEASAPGGLAGIEVPFSRWLGFRVEASSHPATYGYKDVAIVGTSAAPNVGQIATQQYEFSPSAVVRFPTSTRVSPYLQAGAGAVIFVPKGASSPWVSRQYRAAGIIGSGVNVRLTRHIDFTAGYRGVIYRTPLFTTEGNPPPGTYSGGTLVRRTLSSQPFVGLTYTFGKGGSE